MRERDQEGAGSDGDDDRPPICPACGVTMGIVVEGDETAHVCLECGYGGGGRDGRRGVGPDG